METWTITLTPSDPDAKPFVFSSDQVLTAHIIAVSAQLESNTWAVLVPNSSPLVLAAWIAVLSAEANIDGINDIDAHMARIMLTPLADFIDAYNKE